MVFCFCSPFALNFNILHSQTCSFVYFVINEWLFKLRLTSYEFKTVRPFSADLWHQQGLFSQRTAVHWMFTLWVDQTLPSGTNSHATFTFLSHFNTAACVCVLLLLYCNSCISVFIAEILAALPPANTGEESISLSILRPSICMQSLSFWEGTLTTALLGQASSCFPHM